MPRSDDITDWNTSSNENGKVSSMQVDMGLTRGLITHHNAIQVKSCPAKGFHYLISYLKTVLADAGSHCSLDMVRFRALTAHLVNYTL